MTANQDTVDWIADATKAGTALRQLIREAHQATRDLRQAKKDVDATLAGAATLLGDRAEELLGEAVGHGLETFGVELDKAIAAAEAGVNKRFDKVADLLMGVGTELPMEGIAEAIAAARRPGAPRS